MHTDPVSQLLTHLRNAALSGKAEVSCPSSKLKCAIAGILKSEGYIRNFAIQESDRGHLEMRIVLDPKRGPLHLKQISTPGRRLHVPCESIGKVLNGFGIAILSTSKGVMTNRDAVKEHVGGELLCEVW